MGSIEAVEGTEQRGPWERRVTQTGDMARQHCVKGLSGKYGVQGAVATREALLR